MLDLDALAAEGARRGFEAPDDAPEEVEEYQPLTTADEGATVDPELTSSLKRLRGARRGPTPAASHAPRSDGAADDDEAGSIAGLGRSVTSSGRELRDDIDIKTRASALRSSLRDSLHDEVTENTRRPRDPSWNGEKGAAQNFDPPPPGTDRPRRVWIGAALLVALGAGTAGYRYYNSGVLSVTSAPPGAMVSVDGEEAGSSPVHLRVPVGSHVIELHLVGHLPFKEVVDVGRDGLPFVQPLSPDPTGSLPLSTVADRGADDEVHNGEEEGAPFVEDGGDVVIPTEQAGGAEALFAHFDEHLEAGRLDAALATLKEAVRIAPSDPRTDALFVRLTAAQTRAAKPSGSVASSVRRPSPDPRRGADAAKVAFAEGEAEVRRHRPAEARARFLESIRLDPTYADPHRSVARIFERDGDLARARYHLERYLRLGGPDHDRRVRRWLEEHR